MWNKKRRSYLTIVHRICSVNMQRQQRKEEFNCRFGDPETEVVLPRLKNDLYDVFLSIIDHKKPLLERSDECCLGIVMASKGYPGHHEKNYPIQGIENVKGKIYFMGVKLIDGKYHTDSGRVLIVIGKGKTIKEARDNALKV